MFQGVSADVSVDVSVVRSADVSVGLSVDKPVGLSVVPRLAVEIAVEISMASAMCLHRVPGPSVEAHGRSAVARGVSAVVCGAPWK